MDNVGGALSPAGCDMPADADHDSHTGPLCSQCQLVNETPDSSSKQGGRSRGLNSGIFLTELEANSTAASLGHTHPHGQTSGEASPSAAKDDLFCQILSQRV